MDNQVGEPSSGSGPSQQTTAPSTSHGEHNGEKPSSTTTTTSTTATTAPNDDPFAVSSDFDDLDFGNDAPGSKEPGEKMVTNTTSGGGDFDGWAAFD